VRRLLITIGAAAAWLLAGHLGLLAVLLYVWATALASTTNTAKTRALEERVNTALGPAGLMAQLNKGIFTNVAGGNTITMTTAQGSVTLHCGALSYFTSGPQAQFLAGITGRLNHLGGIAMDPNSGTLWADLERADYINDLRALWNDLVGGLQNNGFMN
jgi:hypothetical protein